MSEKRQNGVVIDWSRVDAAHNRGYEQGMIHGAAKERGEENWHTPECRPNHLERIVVIVEPFDRRTLKMARKSGEQVLVLHALYVSGKHACMEAGGEYSEEEWPNVAVIGKENGVLWDDVILWLSVEPPEWLKIERSQNERI